MGIGRFIIIFKWDRKYNEPTSAPFQDLISSNFTSPQFALIISALVFSMTLIAYFAVLLI